MAVKTQENKIFLIFSYVKLFPAHIRKSNIKLKNHLLFAFPFIALNIFTYNKIIFE